MTHDLFCPEFDSEEDGFDHSLDSPFCYCELIANVRADQMRADYVAFSRANLDWYNKFMEDQKDQGYYDWFEMWLNQYTAILTTLVHEEIFTDKEA